MEQAKKISGQAETQISEKELTQKELEKVSGGLKMAPTVFDPELEPLTDEFGGRGGISGDLGGRGGLGGEV